MQSNIGDGGRGALKGCLPEIAGVDPHVEGEDDLSTRAKGIAAADDGNGDLQTETPVSNPWTLRRLMPMRQPAPVLINGVVPRAPVANRRPAR
jgi:hypothetical protein